MADRTRIVLFCEDRAHELFVRALVDRLAAELHMRPVLQAPSTRGGHARALEEFKVWQRSFLRQATHGIPDLLVLVIDANCSPWNEVRRELEAAIDETVMPHHVVGCPDPHVERWYIADPVAFQQVVGVQPGRDRDECDPHFYKQLIDEAVGGAGIPLLTGPADLAPDLVAAMDFYRAGRNQPSLRHFVDDLRGRLRRLAESRFPPP
jgi:hypothetical protein